MTSEPAPADREAVTIGEDDVDEAILASSGDVRHAILSLLLALDSARREASWGYVRGRPSRSINAREG